MRRGLVVAAGLVALGRPAGAQNTNDVNARIQFDFSLPGARSLAMGGAFVAVADDATAAYSNPAGLVVLSKLEITMEGRQWGFRTPIVSSGHAYGPPSGVGFDSGVGLVERQFDTDAQRPSFISVVYPRSRWSFGGFLHVLSRFNTRRESAGPFFDCAGGYRDDVPPRAPFCEVNARKSGIDREPPKRQTLALEVKTLGASVAHRFSDKLSAGASVVGHAFRLDSVNRVYSARGGWFESPNWDPANVELESVQKGDDHALAGTVGVLYRPSSNLAFGASYRRGPKFRFDVGTFFGPSHPCVGPTRLDSCQSEVEAGQLAVHEPTNPFKVPDTYAAGLAFNPTQNTTLSLEYDRVQFSQLADDLRDIARPSDEESAAVRSHLVVPDSNQIRFGFEYLKLFRENILGLQVGTWWDPDHALQFRPDDRATGYPAPRWALLFPPGRDEVHVTAGAGFVYSEILQLDAAFDYSRSVKTFSLSLVVMP